MSAPTGSAVFASAGRAFAELVRAVPDSVWTAPGLGDWDVRSLVGHASRSLITVSTYLQTRAERADVTSPGDYYAKIGSIAAGAGAAAIVERGRQAGRDLGVHPPDRIDAMVATVLAELEAVVDDPLIEVIGGLGIRLSDYLPTRTFELVVHGLDLTRATGVGFALPADALTEAAVLAARIGVALGHGDQVLMALTGRIDLPPGFSVV